MRLGEYPPLGTSAADAEHGSARPQDDPAAEPLFDPLGELGVLTGLGLSKPLLARCASKARHNGTTIESEILACGEVNEEAYYGAIARLLRLPLLTSIDASRVVHAPGLDTQLAKPTMLRITHRHKPQEVAIVPEAARLADLTAALVTMPLLGRDLAITTPSAIRSAVWRADAPRRVREAANGLFERCPWFSARIVLSGQQGFYGGLLLAMLSSWLLIDPMRALFWLHVMASLIYLAGLCLRLTALMRKTAAPSPPKPRPAPPGPLPRYTVLVALYQEAAMAEQLVASLSRLDWPISLIEIKLVCEAHDRATIEALVAAKPGPQFEIVEVPAGGPQTKPKALTYAMGAATGEFLAVYDAEDKPHPRQLREAYAAFRAGPPELACLQAPLIICNAQESWLSAMFSLEYAGLFRAMLPMLGKMGMPMPLGGTSNHFRTEALKAAGGWDPYNVTEDADMGMRLFRLGYTADVISHQTVEEAPTQVDVWMAQRSRWYKGWLQTWLVLMRRPRNLVGEIGGKAFLVLQLLIGGMLASALLHPLIFLFFGLSVSMMLDTPATDLPAGALPLFIIDFANILGSYLIFTGLGLGSMTDYERRRVGRRWAAVPLYWLMMSFAAWRAVFELRSKPFHWNKTPHRPMRT